MTDKKALPERVKAPYQFGKAVKNIGGITAGNYVELSGMSADGKLVFGKFISGLKKGLEFGCAVNAVAEVDRPVSLGKAVLLESSLTPEQVTALFVAKDE